MPLPIDIDARRYYRCAMRRHGDAVALLLAERASGAVYLAGYGVECMLKALALSVLPRRRRRDLLDLFRGSRGHNLEWLRSQYLHHGGTAIPRKIRDALAVVLEWSTELRYQPAELPISQAEEFLLASSSIIHWADGRL